MLGLHDFWVGLAYVLCLGAALLCVVYGLINWNKDSTETPTAALKEDAQWDEEQEKIEDEL